jgi:single-strand DNA-binding protein
MASLNRVHIIGNVVRTPELRHTPGGKAVCDLSVAVNRTYKAEDGERREEVTFLEITVWGRPAEVAVEYLRKGAPVYLEGRLQQSSWIDKQSGDKRTKLGIVAENLQMLGSRQESRAASPGPERPEVESDVSIPF